MNIGQEVGIEINNPKKWHIGAFAALNGKTGNVVEIKEYNKFDENNILVEFHTPAETWHSYQIPWTAAWFSEKDLILL